MVRHTPAGQGCLLPLTLCCLAVWAAEIETPDFLEAWRNVLSVIEGLEVERIIPGHLESASGLELDAEADMAHNRKYLDMFATKITYAEKKSTIPDLRQAFAEAFPQSVP